MVKCKQEILEIKHKDLNEKYNEIACAKTVNNIKNMEENKIEKFKHGYEAKKYETNVYDKWEKSGYFNPDNLPKENIKLEDTINEKGELKEKTFTSILPPPNVTGTLHTGHAIMLAVQDTVIRYKRMNGYKTLWLPGTDHAAIATQSKVEKELSKKGETRHSLGREKFLEKVNDFAMESQATILSQFRSMGASLDWSRLAFTLDENRNTAVNTMFAKMYNDGLVYRGHRIVNWDPKGQTTISDDELVYVEEKSKLYYLKYGPFVIATARPETKFGDKYVVMHPDDERYKEYTHMQKIKVEWINGVIEATVIKDNSIDMTFGSGVMTITPWHSVVDFELAQKYNLDYEQIIDNYGKLLSVAGEEFSGLKIKDAREKIIAKLKSKNLLIDKDGKEIEISEIEDYTHNISTAERTGGIIEPQIMLQWFVAVNKEFNHFGKVTTIKTLMHEAVSQVDSEKENPDQIKIMPERYGKVYHHWIDNLRDWCISRQIWYGHRVPVWYDQNDNIVTTGHITKEIEDKYKADNKMSELIIRQDEDTLDTWFSSGMWTFSTLGWPHSAEATQGKPGDLDKYHPTDFMETGHDILFFWVARMIMMSTYALNVNPFKTVYLHGLVRDAQGRKMSKSLGNTLDPRELCDKYGTDALRMSLIVGNGPGNDLKLAEDKIKAYKNFANKIWNATRFVLEKTHDYNGMPDESKLIPEHKKIYDESIEKIKEITSDFENYRLHLASEKAYDYFWHQFCDVHIENLKNQIVENTDTSVKESAQATLLIILRNMIITLHPFMPFVTEEIWTSIKKESDDLLIVTKWVV